LVKRSAGQSPLVRPRCRWEDITLDLEEAGLDAVGCIYFVQDKDQWLALVNLVLNHEVP
jgi:hypothetical protein